MIENKLVKIGLSDQIKCVEREISKRKYFYPKWIKEGRVKLTQEKADQEITEMEAVKATLVELYEKSSTTGQQLGLGIQVNNTRLY